MNRSSVTELYDIVYIIRSVSYCGHGIEKKVLISKEPDILALLWHKFNAFCLLESHHYVIVLNLNLSTEITFTLQF